MKKRQDKTMFNLQPRRELSQCHAEWNSKLVNTQTWSDSPPSLAKMNSEFLIIIAIIVIISSTHDNFSFRFFLFSVTSSTPLNSLKEEVKSVVDPFKLSLNSRFSLKNCKEHLNNYPTQSGVRVRAGEEFHDATTTTRPKQHRRRNLFSSDRGIISFFFCLSSFFRLQSVEE